MKVFICYQCSYDFCETWRVLTHIYANEIDAIAWEVAEEPTVYDGTTTDWREYEEKEVE